MHVYSFLKWESIDVELLPLTGKKYVFSINRNVRIGLPLSLPEPSNLLALKNHLFYFLHDLFVCYFAHLILTLPFMKRAFSLCQVMPNCPFRFLSKVLESLLKLFIEALNVYRWISSGELHSRAVVGKLFL